jgi:hypothetical protein
MSFSFDFFCIQETTPLEILRHMYKYSGYTFREAEDMTKRKILKVR